MPGRALLFYCSLMFSTILLLIISLSGTTLGGKSGLSVTTDSQRSWIKCTHYRVLPTISVLKELHYFVMLEYLSQ